VRNFRDGRLVDTTKDTMRMGGEFIREQNSMIKCSNVYVDADGREIVSPLEYETIGLMGTNCGLTDPDDVARMNAIANDLGIDTIEAGATLGLLMDHGEAEFGDTAFMEAALEDIRRGNERGRILAQGAARVGRHYGVARVPVVKGQAISAYDPRSIEVTGITMMVTAQGADHTAGNLPAMDCKGKSTAELTEASLGVQVNAAIADSLGLCLFGRSVTDAHHELIVTALNDALGTDLPVSFLAELGRETLELELAFNKAAGFTEEDDELPAFFYAEPVAPTDKVARHHTAEVNQARSAWFAQG
jgi:aldehyde:ferredoxin oxidoreductase